MCATLFGAVGRPFNEDQLEHLKTALKGQLTAAFSESPRSKIVISYSAHKGSTMLNYLINHQWFTVAGAYEDWTTSREPPLFGTEPDARVMALANEAEDRSSYRILDIGAGTGRNALALARLGHPVDVVEMTPAFANEVRTEAERCSLNVRVIERDVFTTTDDLRRDYQLILLSEVVSDFRTTEQLRGLFELAARCLPPGGLLLFNAFVAHRDYMPDAAARELGQQLYTPSSRRTNSPARRGRYRLRAHLRPTGIRLREGQPPCGRVATDELVRGLGEWVGRLRRSAGASPDRDALARLSSHRAGENDRLPTQCRLALRSSVSPASEPPSSAPRARTSEFLEARCSANKAGRCAENPGAPVRPALPRLIRDGDLRIPIGIKRVTALSPVSGLPKPVAHVPNEPTVPLVPPPCADPAAQEIPLQLCLKFKQQNLTPMARSTRYVLPTRNKILSLRE